MTTDELILLSDIAGVDRLVVITSDVEATLSPADRARFQEGRARLLAGEPLAYILGHKEFFGLDFEVTPDTLIPRPETEILVEAAITKINLAPNPLIIDVGTGSGCIIISLAKHTRGTFIATDISSAALDIAQKNATHHDVAINFIKGNLIEPLKNFDFSSFSDIIITANLPYIPDADYDALSPEVHHEPKTALVGGSTGLELYEQLFNQLNSLNLKIPITIFTEHQPDQHASLTKIANTILSTATFNCIPDLAGFDRMTIISQK